MAEGVLTPAALHLRAAAGETGQREGVGGGDADGGVGTRATMSQTSFQSGDGESSSAAASSVPPNVSCMCAAAGGPRLLSESHLGLIKGGAGQHWSCSLFPPLG